MAHLWLIGMMGSGKTVVGRRIAELTGCRFVDTDVRVVSEAGRSIAEMFEGDGEASFREAEAAVLNRLAGERDTVVATGGGIVLSDANIDLIRATGTVVYLAARPATLARRIGDEPGRPLLVTADRLTVLTEVLAARSGLYDRACHGVIETDDLTPDQVAGEAIVRWNRF
ncbi:MAG: shikimate kinase [Acidimicrobiia bacterium]|nr:shikimate kinase [Acidimicrobiia bacterium]